MRHLKGPQRVWVRDGTAIICNPDGNAATHTRTLALYTSVSNISSYTLLFSVMPVSISSVVSVPSCSAGWNQRAQVSNTD